MTTRRAERSFLMKSWAEINLPHHLLEHQITRNDTQKHLPLVKKESTTLEAKSQKINRPQSPMQEESGTRACSVMGLFSLDKFGPNRIWVERYFFSFSDFVGANEKPGRMCVVGHRSFFSKLRWSSRIDSDIIGKEECESPSHTLRYHHTI